MFMHVRNRPRIILGAVAMPNLLGAAQTPATPSLARCSKQAEQPWSNDSDPHDGSCIWGRLPTIQVYKYGWFI